jgi:branched-subunit amino acid aminotransferase/4-amino-4-deoxychorismate lyase
LIGFDQLTNRLTLIGRLNGFFEVIDFETMGTELVDIDSHHDRMAWSAQRLNLARARHALDLQLHAVGHPLEIVR